MNKKIYFITVFALIFFLLLSEYSFSQQSEEGFGISISADKVFDDSDLRESPSRILIWENDLIKSNTGEYFFITKTPIAYTSFGIGWKADSDKSPAGHFTVKFRVRQENGEWSDYYEDEAYVHPSETPTELYFTNLLFPPTEEAYHYIEFSILAPEKVHLQMVRMDIIDIRGTGKPGPAPGDEKAYYESEKSCPPFPAIITRADWCGGYTACHNPTYTPTYISATHTVLHHGASPDTYTDGHAVVRSYWNYHVNTLKWADIGYNYLFDKYGNFFQGRFNPNLPNSDVRGAHAGNSNGASIGLNYLGNSDVTLPTTAQLNKTYEFLAWWYDRKGFDPTSSATIALQSGGSGSVPRICGHKDVNIGGTACPGNAAYAQLSSIRTNTKSIIDNCNNNVPTNLQRTLHGCPNNQVTFNWTNSGTGWYIQVSTASNYSNPYWKWVSGLTSYLAPGEFVLQSDGVTNLVFQEGTTYYWRIHNGSSFTNGPSFSIPYCSTNPPTTSISVSYEGDWVTENFTATFNDVANQSVIARRFYQVLEYDGTYWGANPNRGFFGDNFETLNTSLWTTVSGTWSVSGNQLRQTDASVNNTNIYAPLNQMLSNRYMYQFVAKVEGSGTTRRFGLHFFCDNASLSERGNSYFVFFRVDDQSLQFYKVTNNTFSLVKTISNVTTTVGQWYDIKVIYDRITGEIIVYRDDVFLGSWTDSSPYSTNGNHISFRTDNSQLYINEIKVYRTRLPEATISVGADNSNDLRTQSPNPTTAGGKIKSIVTDNLGNLSQIAYYDLKIDRTPPTNISYVYDGIGSDISQTNSTTQLSANWANSSDVNSGIKKYWYAIGTSAGNTNIVGWTDNGTNTSVTHTGLTLTNGTTYYFSVRSENGAGLLSTVASSNGQTVVVGPTNLQHTLHGCPNNNVTFSWTNSGSGWYIQVSKFSNFSSPYWKWVSGLTSYTGPAGFVLQSDGVTPLQFEDATTYYWRIYGNGAFTSSLNFTTPTCNCTQISDFPYFQNFNNGEGQCWSVESVSETTWTPLTGFTIGETINVNPVSGSHLYRCQWTATENQNEWLISPVFNFTNLSSPEISFKFTGSYHWSVINPNCDLDLMIRINAGSWNKLWNNKDHSNFTSNDINWTWLNEVVSLSSYAGQNNVQLAFRYTGFDGAAFALDEIKVSNMTIPGDVNNDGSINVLDIVWLVNHLNGSTPTGFNFSAADVNNDGLINIADLTNLINIIFNGAKLNENKVDSEQPHLYLDEDGLIRFISDGTILAIHFQLICDELQNMEVDLLLQTGHTFVFNNVTGYGLLYSMSGSLIPEGEIDLFQISGVDFSGVSWGMAQASNLNHQAVDIITHSFFDPDDGDEPDDDDDGDDGDDDDDGNDDGDDDGSETFISDNYEIISEILVYPNPSTGNFSVSFKTNEAIVVEIIIYDEIGRSIYRKEATFNPGYHSIKFSKNDIHFGNKAIILVNIFDIFKSNILGNYQRIVIFAN
ncbi:MAG: hypothetical protein KGZ97_09985 [Bacteroidetes bacterium]|nr:hypothetical protein [Bacteroidota bacterium]